MDIVILLKLVQCTLDCVTKIIISSRLPPNGEKKLICNNSGVNTFHGLPLLVRLQTVLREREFRDTWLTKGDYVGQQSASLVQRFTHHPDQSRVGFSLFHCHLDHRTGTFQRQHRHGNTVWDCAALPIGQRPETGEELNDRELEWDGSPYIIMSLSEGIVWLHSPPLVFELKSADLSGGRSCKKYPCLDLKIPFSTGTAMKRITFSRGTGGYGFWFISTDQVCWRGAAHWRLTIPPH